MKKASLVKKINAVIFCIDSDNEITFNDVFSGKYDDSFLLHTGLWTGEALSKLSDKDKDKIDEFIHEINLLNNHLSDKDKDKIQEFIHEINLLNS